MNKYWDLKIREVRPETNEAICIEFEAPAEGMPYRAGQFLTLIAEVNGKEVRRSYSLCTSPSSDAHPAVGIKRVAGGLMSNFLNDNVAAGQTLRVMEPMGNFTTVIAENQQRHVVLISGGSGITPMLGLAKDILAGEPNSRVSLLYANQHEQAIMFRSTWDGLKKQYGERLTLLYTLDEASASWEGPVGRLNRDSMAALIKQLPEQGVHTTEYFVCGPQGLMQVAFETLEYLGVPQDRIKKEVFATKKMDKDTNELMADNAQNEGLVEDPNKAYDVTIVLDGEEHTFTVEPGYSILETGLDEGLDMPYSCQSGLCTACRGKLLSGKVTMEETEGLSDEEIEEGYVLNCVGHPVTENVKIEIG